MRRCIATENWVGAGLMSDAQAASCSFSMDGGAVHDAPIKQFCVSSYRIAGEAL
jgi:hypothetical protein